MIRSRTLLMLLCAMMLLAGGCASRTAARSGASSKVAQQPIKPALLSDYIRGIYKVSSEASKQAEQRAALLSSAPELEALVDRAEQDPNDNEARTRIVSEYLSRDLYWGAYELLTNTLSENTNDPDVDISLAVIWDAWGQYSLAAQYGERAINNGAASAAAYETIGRIRLHQNEPAEAIAWYSRSLENDPKASTLANIGYAHMLTSEWEPARTNLEAAVALDDSLEQAHNNLAVVLSKTGDSTGALAHLLKTGRPAVAFNNMGVLYLNANDLRSAQHYFEEALRLEPAYETARINLEAIQELMPPPSIIDLPENSNEPESPPAASL